MNLEQSNIALTDVFERLGVADADEIFLDEDPSGNYVARSRSKRAFVDRALAVRLRFDGAIWCGRLSRDPCAVA
jgi:hypothetical protein